MKLSLTVLVFLLAYTLVDSQRSASAIKYNKKRVCQMTRQQANKFAKTLLVFGDRDQFVPHNYDEAGIFCNGMFEALGALKRYGNCLSRFKATLLRTFAYHVREELKSNYCSENGRREMAEKVKCIDKEQVRANLSHACMDRYVYTVTMIRDELDAKYIFPAGCCAFQLFRQCLSNFADEYCTHISGEGTKTYWDQMVTRTFNAVQGPICEGKWDSVDNCNKNIPEVMVDYNNVYSRYIAPQSENPFTLFMDYIDSNRKGRSEDLVPK
ncbi:hypothetical protein HDE_01375 [Halotydeus destructor]|nr:hypothetical protein HDE_01375 [Halotydeus destructor]